METEKDDPCGESGEQDLKRDQATFDIMLVFLFLLGVLTYVVIERVIGWFTVGL